MSTEAQLSQHKLDDVPGWFHTIDRMLFRWILGRQERCEPPGDLVELGTYMGKSAITIGGGLREGEKFTVCDLFGSLPLEEDNRHAAQFYTDHLNRDAFERHYLAFHERLPEVVQAPTSTILDHVTPDSCRFVHIDASHLYELVRNDITAAQEMLRTGGVLVMDDYRTAHTPGTAAAVWEAVLNRGLRPICLTGMKFYATWGDPRPIQDELSSWAAGLPELRISVDHVAENRLLRASLAHKSPPQPPPRQHTPTPEPKPVPQRRRMRRWVRDAVPPILLRLIRRLRRQWRMSEDSTTVQQGAHQPTASRTETSTTRQS